MTWALITGATSHLGTSLSHALGSRGFKLLLTAPKEHNLLELQQKFSTETKIFPADLIQPKERQALISWMTPYIPKLVINNAGMGLYGPALLHPSKENLDILTLNANALLELTLESAQLLRSKNQPGTILNIASAAAAFSYPTFSVYSASKSFVTNFSRAFDVEMKPHGIRILCACPGQINTDFRLKASKNHFQKKTPMTLSTEKVTEALMKQIERKKPFQIIDWRYRLLTYFLNFLPLSLRHYLLRLSISKRWNHPSDKRATQSWPL